MRRRWFLKYKHKCKDGSVKVVYRDVNDAFPLFIEDFKGSVDGNLEAIKGAPVKVRADYETKIKGLTFELDELNKSLMMSFRTVYLVFQSDPCNDDGFFKRQTERLLLEHSRNTTFREQIRYLINIAEMNPDHPERVLPVYKQILNQMGGTTIQKAAELEISETRTIADKWIEGRHES
jgi:hypothetical protein